MYEEQARKKTNKNIEKVNNSQKSMILRKFLFLVEFEPSASYKNNSYKNKPCIMDEFKATLDDVFHVTLLSSISFILSMVMLKRFIQSFITYSLMLKPLSLD